MAKTNKATITSLIKGAQRFWLMKTEPTECSVDDALAKPVSWFGIRNYQARNFIRDGMREGDAILFYHSSCPQPGVVGLATIVSKPYPDELQFDATSEYFDPKSKEDSPRWVTIDVKALLKCPVIPIVALREHEELSQMRVLQKGNRLSITPVTKEEFEFIVREWICPTL